MNEAAKSLSDCTETVAFNALTLRAVSIIGRPNSNHSRVTEERAASVTDGTDKRQNES